MYGRRSWICCTLPLIFAGCHHCGTQSCYQPAPVIRSAGILPPAPLTPCQSCAVPPPAAPFIPPAPVAPPSDSGFHPMPPGPAPSQWGPASPPGVSLGVPVPALPRESARVGVPESPEPPKAPNAEMPREPEAAVKPRRSPSLPAGIANFAEAVPGVAAGLRPTLDGIEWLKTNEYRAVLQLRAPGENDDGDRRGFEQKGLRYISLEVSPKTLTPQLVEEFNKIVTEPGNRPLFVYDADGSFAGALWYLHFRTAGKLSDEEARRKAAALGLKEDAEGGPRELWLAIQKFLDEMKK
jgi:protein tyrosine phosphatase (PTP) superfamily phosphohydrolase (DUF442 family)